MKKLKKQANLWSRIVFMGHALSQYIKRYCEDIEEPM